MTIFTSKASRHGGNPQRRMKALFAASALALATLPTWAGPVGYTAWDVSGSDKLVRMDLATGIGTVIGTGIGFDDVDGLSFDDKGRLWGVQDGAAIAGGNRLIQIDVNTGVGTAAPTGFGDGFNDMGLAFGGGTMYMAATDTAGVVGSLYTVDTSTGTASLKGTFGLDENGKQLRIRSLGYYGNTLYGWSNRDTLVTINTSTGDATTVGHFSFASLVSGQDGFDIDPLTGIGWSVSEVERRTYQLNLATGVATIVATGLTCGGDPCGDANTTGGFNSLAIAPVPEPSTYALMGLGLLSIGAVTRRRTTAAQR